MGKNVYIQLTTNSYYDIITYNMWEVNMKNNKKQNIKAEHTNKCILNLKLNKIKFAGCTMNVNAGN